MSHNEFDLLFLPFLFKSGRVFALVLVLQRFKHNILNKTKMRSLEEVKGYEKILCKSSKHVCRPVRAHPN